MTGLSRKSGLFRRGTHCIAEKCRVSGLASPPERESSMRPQQRLEFHEARDARVVVLAAPEAVGRVNERHARASRCREVSVRVADVDRRAQPVAKNDRAK